MRSSDLYDVTVPIPVRPYFCIERSHKPQLYFHSHHLAITSQRYHQEFTQKYSLWHVNIFQFFFS